MKLFWKWLETRRNLTAVVSQWSFHSGKFFEIINPMLHVRQGTASSFPNPRPDGGPMKVVYHNDGAIVAVDEDDVENRLDLSHGDILLHRLNLNLFRKSLSEAFVEVQISRTPINPELYYFHVGNWEPKKAASFPVYLFLCQTSKILREQILLCQYSCNRPGAILLTSTRDKWNESIEQLARSAKMLLVPLSEVIAASNGKFVEADNWAEYLQAFCQMVETTLPANYQNKKARPKRGVRMNLIGELERQLHEHLVAARDHAHLLTQRGQAPVLLPRPEHQQLAKMVGVSASSVTRAFQDDHANMLLVLWETADDLDGVMRYKR